MRSYENLTINEQLKQFYERKNIPDSVSAKWDNILIDLDLSDSMLKAGSQIYSNADEQELAKMILVEKLNRLFRNPSMPTLNLEWFINTISPANKIGMVIAHGGDGLNGWSYREGKNTEESVQDWVDRKSLEFYNVLIAYCCNEHRDDLTPVDIPVFYGKGMLKPDKNYTTVYMPPAKAIP